MEYRVEDALKRFLEQAALLESGLGTLAGEPGFPYDEGAPFSASAYRRLRAILRERMPPFYAAYDAYVRAALAEEDRPVTCSSGCSACCRHFVSSVEPFEIVALHEAIKGRDNYPDILFASHKNSMAYEKIMETERPDDEAADRALYRYFLKGRSCPFLARDGSCGVYEARPMSCRMFFSESPARFCAGKAIASPWNRNFQIELPEQAEEALARCSRHLESLDLPEDLFPAVLAANALFGPFDSLPDPA